MNLLRDHSPFAPDVIDNRNQIRRNRNGNFFCSHISMINKYDKFYEIS